MERSSWMIVMGPGRNHKCGKKRHVREGAVTLAGREVGRHDVDAYHTSTSFWLCERAGQCQVLARCQAEPREKFWNSLGQKKSLNRVKKKVGAVSLVEGPGKC